MMRGIGDLLDGLGMLLPPWAVGALLVAVGFLVLPAWVDNVRIKQIRGTVRRMVRADEPARAALAERAMALAGRRRMRLIAVVESAIKYDQRALRSRGLEALAAVHGPSAAHLREQLGPERQKTVLHPLEVVVRVERLLEEGMVDAARDRVEEALARHPDDPELRQLQSRLRQA